MTILLAVNAFVVVVAMILFPEEFDPGVQKTHELCDAVQLLVEDLH
jgi:hypothetical protein